MSIFKNKTQNSSLTPALFGFVALVVIAVVAVILITLLSKSNSVVLDRDVDVDVSENLVEIPASLSLEEQKQNYESSVAALLVELDQSQDDLDEVLSRVEDHLLQVRTPSSYQEKHLEAVLSIARLRADIQNIDDPSSIKEKIRVLLENLNQEEIIESAQGGREG